MRRLTLQLQVIVFSMVRSNTQGDVGFLSEQRRNNVAITRARRLLCVAVTCSRADCVHSTLNCMIEASLVLY
jgi:hypothetical protein